MPMSDIDFEQQLDQRSRLMAEKRSFTVDDRGHSVSFGWLQPIDFLGYLRIGLGLDEVAKAWDTDTPMETPVKVRMPEYREQTCSYCGAREYLFDGFNFVATTACKDIDGWEMSVELSVPSGRLYIGNDFRKHFSIDDDDPTWMSVNKASGIRNTVKLYGEAKMLHFFVSNSSPTVRRIAFDSFEIASFTEEESETAVGEAVAHVCTDLWWVSIVDGDEADRRGMTLGKLDSEVEVTPGTYTLKYHYLNRQFDDDGGRFDGQPDVYAHLIRKND